MNGIPADLLLYIIIACALVLWLRNTLGTRTGNERQRPNPFDNKDTIEGAELHSILGEVKNSVEAHTQDLPKNMLFANSMAESGLREIIKQDRTFDPKTFVENAKDAFVMVVEGFADGDRDILKALLSDGVYEGFDEALKAREKAGETVETEIHAIKKAEIVETTIDGKMAYVAFQFTAEETTVIKDKKGKILSGDPDRITDMCDIWVFGRDMKAKDPTWKVFETRDGEPEDHKTPIPDAK
ncbi:MAG: Tim44/TimA family putative adaptor protein [Bdellovibrionales bacterium]